MRAGSNGPLVYPSGVTKRRCHLHNTESPSACRGVMLGARFPCSACKKLCANLDAHYYHSPECDTVAREMRPCSGGKTSAPVSERETLFRFQYANALVADCELQHWTRFTPMSTCESQAQQEAARLCVLEEYMHDELKTHGANGEMLSLVHSLFGNVRQVAAKFRSKSAIVSHIVNVTRAPFIESQPLDGTIARDKSRKDAHCLSLQRLLVRQLQWSREARRQTMAKSSEWKTGRYHRVHPAILVDLEDGSKVRDSWVMERCTDPSVLHVLYQIHVDDITTVNGLGTKAGKHKYCVTGAANCNLQLDCRYSWEYLMMLSVVNAKVVKEKGMVYAWCGVDKHGMRQFNDSLAAEVAALEKGIEVWLPDDENPGEEKKYLLRALLVNVASDWLANASLGPNAESTGADFPCTWCWWLSFEAQQRRGGRKRLACGQRAALRTHAQQKATVEKMRAETKGISKTALANRMKTEGIYRLHYALDDAYFHSIDTVLDRPPDVMHLLGSGGIVAHENGMMCKILMGGAAPLIEDGWEKFNQAAKQLRCLPRHRRIPAIRPSAEGTSMKDTVLDLKAAEQFAFAAHGKDLIEPMLTARARADPAWTSWLAMRELTLFCMRDAYESATMRAELTFLIKTHRDAFDKVPEYVGLERPKHHFLDHLGGALARFGPFRLYWCMPWEGNLKLVNQIVNMNNYKSVAASSLDFWSMRSALQLRRPTQDFGNLDASFTTETLTLDTLDDAYRVSSLAASCRVEFPAMDGIRFLRHFESGLVSVITGVTRPPPPSPPPSPLSRAVDFCNTGAGEGVDPRHRYRQG